MLENAFWHDPGITFVRARLADHTQCLHPASPRDELLHEVSSGLK